MKKVLLSLGGVPAIGIASAQDKIKDGSVSNSTALPDNRAVLELESSWRGLLIPRFSLTNTTSWPANPANGSTTGSVGVPGFLAYNTNSGVTSTNTNYPVLPGGLGLYYWDGAGWVAAKYSSTASYQEPWNIQKTTTLATLNNQNITQRAAVAIMKDSSYIGSNSVWANLDVNGAVRFGSDPKGDVGANSFAGGYQSIASSDRAFAFGNAAKATGTESFSIGNNTTASGAQSFAGGGNGSTATGQYSFAFGNNAQAKANHGLAIGVGTIAQARSGAILGRYNITGDAVPNITLNKPGDVIYKFSDLYETEKFIKSHHHLPGVTSIAELEKTENGYSIDLGKTTTQNLEKTEELYLHVIEQQKQIDSQKETINTLTETLKSLTERLNKLENNK